MTNYKMISAALWASVACAIILPAQSAQSRLASVRDGQLRFTFQIRPGVCGSGRNVWYNRNNVSSTSSSRTSRDVEYDVDCDVGPGRIVVDKDRGEIIDLRVYVGGRWRSNPNATDIGQISTREAADLLMEIARTENNKAGRNAIFPLTLIDSVDVSRELLRIARDDNRPRETRKQSVFWLGQLAEGPATEGLTALVGDDALDREVREQVVFALSQRPKDEGVPALINVVRTHRDPEIRKKALFWLGQSGDPRALDLIEELLTKR